MKTNAAKTNATKTNAMISEGLSINKLEERLEMSDGLLTCCSNGSYICCSLNLGNQTSSGAPK